MKQKIINILVIISGILTIIQFVLPKMPIPPGDMVGVSAVLMFLVNIATIWKETLSKIIDKRKMYASISIGIIATLGGVNHLMEVIHFSDNVAQWIRFGITGVTMGLNSGTIKLILFPNDTSTEIPSE